MAAPSQWDAWDEEGHYWYLRYRFGIGTATRSGLYAAIPDGLDGVFPNLQIRFIAPTNKYGQSEIELDEFCELAGIELAIDPEPTITGARS